MRAIAALGLLLIVAQVQAQDDWVPPGLRGKPAARASPDPSAPLVTSPDAGPAPSPAQAPPEVTSFPDEPYIPPGKRHPIVTGNTTTSPVAKSSSSSSNVHVGVWHGTRLDRSGAINTGGEIDWRGPGILGDAVRPTLIAGLDQVGGGVTLDGGPVPVGAGVSVDTRGHLPEGNRRVSLVVWVDTFRW